MAKRLKLYIVGVVGASALALAATTLLFPVDRRIGAGLDLFGSQSTLAGLAFWCLATLIASALPVRMPRGTLVSVSIAPLIAATMLGGPTAGAWVAFIGSTEIRELRGRIPWYGTLANHGGIVIPAIVAGVVMQLGGVPADTTGELLAFAWTIVGAGGYFAINASLTATLVSLRTGESFRSVLVGDAKGFATSLLGLAPLGWLMAQMYTVTWWASLIFAVPLWTTRRANHNFMEMREMFTQTITALAGAVDRRDPFTGRHSWRVKEIAGEIGRVMRLGDADLEALEWGGLLHDVGKIGVPDNVLLKQERLNREERMLMNAHPVLGAQIIAPVTRLSRELPIIRHHHEWFNGSGYPDRLIGDEIPLLARILHVADAFEAMTAQRPYRMTPLTGEQAIGELRKYAGVQFDPKIVDAFVRTSWADGIPDPGRDVEPTPIPLLAAHGNRAATSAGGPAASAVDPS
jgi:putative nucleotidyltransferase with HDIG domain